MRYRPNQRCEWLITAPRHDQKVGLRFRYFDLHPRYDRLEVEGGGPEEVASFRGGQQPRTIISGSRALHSRSESQCCSLSCSGLGVDPSVREGQAEADLPLRPPAGEAGLRSHLPAGDCESVWRPLRGGLRSRSVTQLPLLLPAQYSLRLEDPSRGS